MFCQLLTFAWDATFFILVGVFRFLLDGLDWTLHTFLGCTFLFRFVLFIFFLGALLYLLMTLYDSHCGKGGLTYCSPSNREFL